jgi:hypothetical protein
LLAYLQGLESRKEKRLLTGQFCGFGPGATVATAERIFEATGEHPAFIGVDYANFKGRNLETRVPNQAALAYWRAGGWVTISVHGFNPANPGGVRVARQRGGSGRPAQTRHTHPCCLAAADRSDGGRPARAAGGGRCGALSSLP